MSTGLGCRIVQTGAEEWKLELEDSYRRDEYHSYGPFKTATEADDYLRANFANPGGMMINRLDGHKCEHVWSEPQYEGDDVECVKCWLPRR